MNIMDFANEWHAETDRVGDDVAIARLINKASVVAIETADALYAGAKLCVLIPALLVTGGIAMKRVSFRRMKESKIGQEYSKSLEYAEKTKVVRGTKFGVSLITDSIRATADIIDMTTVGAVKHTFAVGHLVTSHVHIPKFIQAPAEGKTDVHADPAAAGAAEAATA